MNYSSGKQQAHLKRAGLAVTALAALFAFSACTGKAFLGEWRVANVIQDEVDDVVESPRAVNRGGKFRIVRQSRTSFRIEADDSFSQFADQWRALEFGLQRGKRGYDPISIVERFPRAVVPKRAELRGSEVPDDGVIVVPTEKIEKLYQILSRANIQSLESPEDEPLKMHKDDHTVQFFLFPNLDTKDRNNLLDLVIFSCHNRKCNHNGVAHAHR